MADQILDPLNPAQRQAVTAAAQHLLVYAGPGTGKTRVITHRIAYFVQTMGIDPEAILAITFTNKAADEMKKRLDNLLDPAVLGKSRPWVGTFHALGHWLLRRHWQEAGLAKDFVIYDREDQKSLMREILDPLEVPPSRARIYLDVIQSLKNTFMYF